MNRRAFLSLAGGAGFAPVFVPRLARAQQMPVVGLLSAVTPDPDRLRAFRQGLKDIGFVDGTNLTIDYRWAESRVERLPELAAELARRPVSVLVAGGGLTAALAAKAATTTVPIVFIVADDPVKAGLVSSLARPASNLTGINFLNAEVASKRLELLRELVPGGRRVAVLVNPADAGRAEGTMRDVAAAARTMGLMTLLLNADSSGEIDSAFATIERERPDMLFVGSGPYLTSRRVQIVQLAARHAIPTSYSSRENADIGGLISYGTNIADAFRQAGAYAGRILKGDKPSDLPVAQASKFELVINAQTARMLELAVPASLLSVADEVIE